MRKLENTGTCLAREAGAQLANSPADNVRNNTVVPASDNPSHRAGVPGATNASSTPAAMAAAPNTPT